MRKLLSYLSFLIFSSITATEFTISSYNVGGLPDYYDFLRAASMQQLMQARIEKEPSNLELHEYLQKLSIKIHLSSNEQEKALAQKEWTSHDYQSIYDSLVSFPLEEASPNAVWFQIAKHQLTPYDIRPISIYDDKLNKLLLEHLQRITEKEGKIEALIPEMHYIMSKKILSNLQTDIICLQEANYVDESMFPSNYDVIFERALHAETGIAWNKDRFELLEIIGGIAQRSLALKFIDKKSKKTVLVTSGHLSGSNPYKVMVDELGNKDSAKGDHELEEIVKVMGEHEADLKLLAMDSNVTAMHPRLEIFKDADYQIDTENFLESTVTNPYTIMNTRIDWIGYQSALKNVSITNIDLPNIGLNNIQTNVSDHKPIAAKIRY